MPLPQSLPGRSAFLLDFASVISSEQVTGFKRVGELLRSSQLIRNLPLFSPSDDTTGDTTNPITRKRSRFTT
jgi:hypothetical protein